MYLWSHLVLGHGQADIDAADGQTLMVISGLGGAAVFSIFVLLHQHAWRLRDELELNELERYDTRASIRENCLLAAVPLLSMVCWPVLVA